MEICGYRGVVDQEIIGDGSGIGTGTHYAWKYLHKVKNKLHRAVNQLAETRCEAAMSSANPSQKSGASATQAYVRRVHDNLLTHYRRLMVRFNDLG